MNSKLLDAAAQAADAAKAAGIHQHPDGHELRWYRTLVQEVAKETLDEIGAPYDGQPAPRSDATAADYARLHVLRQEMHDAHTGIGGACSAMPFIEWLKQTAGDARHTMQDGAIELLALEGVCLLHALDVARKAIADILDNCPYFFPARGHRAAMTDEQAAWRAKVEEVSRSVRSVVTKARYAT